MYNYFRFYILVLITAFAVGACSDDLEQEPQEVDFCVRAVWQDGLSGGQSTRALSATNILADGTSDITIGFEDYPNEISVMCKKGETEVLPLILTKGTALCADHNDYWQYTPSIIYKDKKIERENLTFAFSATIDNGDVLSGTANQADITDKTGSGQRHMQITLHHTKTLLRFAFKVDAHYDKVRYIKVTGINLNGNDCELVDKVLTQADQFIAYAYIDPTEVTTTTKNTVLCTYNIYDKDEATDAHLTRKGVVATNQFKLGSLKDKSDNFVTEIRAGYYYDLHVTLNPDYLYVLSEHDNKHITIE